MENDESTNKAITNTNRSQKRRMPDLSYLYEDISPTTLQVSQMAALKGEDTAIVIPQELEYYLPSDLWRKLQADTPRRGVLLNVVDRLRSVLYLIATYLPAHLVQEKLNQPIPGLVEGELLNGTLLFTDVSGFTALSERLAALGTEGAEQLTLMMNQYFCSMLEIITWSGGDLIKFAGDATLVFFPEQADGNQVNWAVRAGLRMLEAIGKFKDIETPYGKVSLNMKAGVATGPFLAASVGNSTRMEYAVLGGSVCQTMNAEKATTGGGQLVVDENTKTWLNPEFSPKEHAPGFYRIEPDKNIILGDFEIKAEKRRGHGEIPWTAGVDEILAQIQNIIRQIQSLSPYLAPELVDRVVAHSRQRQIESEYRPTTVMFCNFYGLDELFASWGKDGASRLTNLLSSYFSALNGIITQYGGIVSRIDPYSHGTKLLILFGAPTAHEDDPQRAVSAAIAINTELALLNEHWRQKFSRHLPKVNDSPLIQQSIGITHGLTFAGQVGTSTRREYTVMGDDVNLAARLMGAAKSGQILISSPMRQEVEDYFILSELKPIRVKGKSKPVEIFQVDGPREDTLSVRIRKRGQFIGRSTELAECQEILEHALAGNGNIITLLGQAGIGKSALANELVYRAMQNGAKALFFQCQPHLSDHPYACWGSLFRSLANITTTDHTLIRQEKLNQLMKTFSLPAGDALPLSTIMGFDMIVEENPTKGIGKNTGQSEDYIESLGQVGTQRKQSKLAVLQELVEQDKRDAGQVWSQLSRTLDSTEHQKLFLAVEHLLKALTQKHPSLIFIEDAQWLDKDSRELLANVYPQLSEWPLMVLLAQRPGDQPASFPGKKLELQPLNLNDTHTFISEIMISELSPLVYEQSRGNPLYIEEITRWIQRTHKIGAADLRDILQTSDIMQKLVLSSMEQYPENWRTVAKVGSVIGNEFRMGEIQALMEENLDQVTLSQCLRELVTEQILVLSEAGVNARYAFSQTIVRDILYNNLPYERRRELHIKIAEYLEKPNDRRRAVQSKIAAFLDFESAPQAGVIDTRIAEHYELAQHWTAASQKWLEASIESFQNNDYAKARTYIQNSQKDADQIPESEISTDIQTLRRKIQMLQGDLALTSNDYQAALSAYEAAYKMPVAPIPFEVEVRLALTLPIDHRSQEAKTMIQAHLDKESGVNLTILNTIQAWLDFRTDITPIADIRNTIPISEISGYAKELLTAILDDLSGAWKEAGEKFSEIGFNAAAGLTCLYRGDQALQQGNIESSRVFYNQGISSFNGDKPDTCGLILTKYRIAACHHQAGQNKEAMNSISEALDLLSQCPINRQKEARPFLQTALDSANHQAKEPWNIWTWHSYEDTVYIPMLFKLIESLTANISGSNL